MLSFKAADELNILKGPEDEGSLEGVDTEELPCGDNENHDSEDSDDDPQIQSDLHLSKDTDGVAKLPSSSLGKSEDVQNFEVISDSIASREEHLSQDSESGDDLEDLSLANREYKPFRNEESMEHVNTHLHSRQRTSDSMCSNMSSVMSPDLVKEKVKRQMKSAKQKQQARRIRKSGEASLVTRKKRETQNDIKQSMGAVWGM